MMGWLKEAVDLAKNSDFDTALGLLQRVGKDQDYRLAEQIEKINQVVSRMTKLRDKNVAGSEALQQKAHEAAGENNHDRVIALLKKVPERLLSEQSATLLRQSEAMLDQAVALNAELKQAMASRDWCLMGGLANQLLALTPENANYQMIASKVGKKLIDGAKRCFQEHRFGRASELLDSVPDCQRDAGFESLRAEIDGIRWLTREIDQEPFASAGLGKMAVRLTKRCNNAENQKRVQQLTKQLKKAPAPSHALNPWNGSRDSWMGSEVGVFSFPQQIECPDALMKRVVKSDQPVAVALGLALQGLGSGRVSEDFLPPKKGILKSLARRKAKSAWGIDLGATALRAVLVSSTDDGFRLEDFVFIPFANPTCRTTTSNDTDTTSEALIVESLTRFYNENQDAISDTPVWANLPGHDVVSRSVQLPPLKDKLATEALQQETKQLLPIDIAELAIVTWLAPSHANPSRGRPALITAARKTALDSRASLFQQAGITLAGMQSSPVAAANFADHEFSDFLDTSSDDDESNVITLVDCGAVSSSLVMLSANALAIWTFENGGEELTKTVAKVTKTVLSDAEKLKCNPAAIEDPAAVFGCVEERLLSLKTRLQRAFDSSFQITATSKTAQVWCVGRGSRCHSWIRHVLIK
jgi:Tfp pilus assembly PilM family ATPase